MKNLSIDNNAPFMCVMDGKLGVFDCQTGEPIHGFVGICTEADTKKFWLLGESNGERSFRPLYSQNLSDAKIEARYYRVIRRMMLRYDLSFHGALDMVNQSSIAGAQREASNRGLCSSIAP